jgi:YegS/Rv2252/BmrU family lipid kinase
VKVRAILNPRAGVAARRTRQAVEQGRPSWRDYAVYLTREAGHATDLARDAVAAGADLVLAVGGDGTVNEVARGVMGSPAALGIVPVGSGNGLARALRIPLQPGRALAALETGVRRRIDVGFLNGQPFLNVAGVGFDAVVGHTFHERGKKGGRRGILGYVRIGLFELVAYRAPRLAIEAGGERLDLPAFVVTFANGPQYGSGAVINPGGRLDDGRLEVVVFEDGPRLRTLAAAPRMFLGGVERSVGYRRLAGSSATVTAGAPVAVHCDGDPSPSAARIEVELRPRALEVMVPTTSLSGPDGPFSA